MAKLRTLFFILAVGLGAQLVSAERVLPQRGVDYDAFLSRQNMIWEQLPRQWNEGAFVGNGQLGIMFYQNHPANPRPELRNDGEMSIAVQPLLAGGDFATVWLERFGRANPFRFRP